MNFSRRDLLIKMLPGFIPLIVFILVDEFWGSKPALIVAIASGIISFLYYLVREKRVDYFLLLDTLLVTILGLISIIFDNDLFFKLKPGFIGIVMCIIMGLSAFTPLNYILAMSRRYLGNMDLNDQQTRQMQRSLRALFYLFTIYTGLVFYSALFMSKEAWAFISGGLFYILLAAFFGYEYIRNRRSARLTSSEEWLPIVDMEGKILGKAPRSACHSNKDLLHPVVHMHIFDKNGNICFQKRSLNKLVQPGKWDTAVGGHIIFGEDLMVSLKREASEEVGLLNFNPLLVSQYKWVSDIESELVYMFITITDQQLANKNDEVDEVRYWTIPQIKNSLSTGIFTQNLEHELRNIIFSPNFDQVIKKAATMRLQNIQ